VLNYKRKHQDGEKEEDHKDAGRRTWRLYLIKYNGKIIYDYAM
jgi:hypothetical protein